MAKTRLTVDQILAWADQHHARTGAWPHANSGAIPATRGENWQKIDAALSGGLRGLPGGSSLCRLLAEKRDVRPYTRSGETVSVEQILAWADAYHARTGKWPRNHSGRIPGARGKSWQQLDYALKVGRWGIPGGSSLVRLLAEKRGLVPWGHSRRPLTVEQILAWADDHFARTGCWPTLHSGRVGQARGESWRRINTALHRGERGLPGGTSLARLLAGRRSDHPRSRLTVERILAWADAHHARTGSWPGPSAGRIAGTACETWKRVDDALHRGARGLPAGSSLTELLRRHRGARYHVHAPRLTITQILAWADSHYQRHGQWPHQRSGPVTDAPGENWYALSRALRTGSRGLPGDLTLARLLAERRGAAYRPLLPRLTVEQILGWADAHQRTTGSWPHTRSGVIAVVPGETWESVNQNLRVGGRGLPGGSSLAQLLAEFRGVRPRKHVTPLCVEQILEWADDHHRRMGRWPHDDSGPIQAAPLETWGGIDHALHKGLRGLPAGLTLSRFLRQQGRR